MGPDPGSKPLSVTNVGARRDGHSIHPIAIGPNRSSLSYLAICEHNSALYQKRAKRETKFFLYFLNSFPYPQLSRQDDQAESGARVKILLI